MYIASGKQIKQHQRYLESLVRNRWGYTASYFLMAGMNLQVIFEKRSQWPSLFVSPITAGIPLWHHIWVNIFSAVMFPLLVAYLWVRVHNYRREQLAAEQEALQKAAMPTEGVWPPAPQSPV